MNAEKPAPTISETLEAPEAEAALLSCMVCERTLSPKSGKPFHRICFTAKNTDCCGGQFATHLNTKALSTAFCCGTGFVTTDTEKGWRSGLFAGGCGLGAGYGELRQYMALVREYYARREVGARLHRASELLSDETQSWADRLKEIHGLIGNGRLLNLQNVGQRLVVDRMNTVEPDIVRWLWPNVSRRNGKPALRCARPGEKLPGLPSCGARDDGRTLARRRRRLRTGDVVLLAGEDCRGPRYARVGQCGGRRQQGSPGARRRKRRGREFGLVFCERSPAAA